MGRAFEYRKARKMKRWGNMARVFTKLGKEITIAAKAGGGDPDTNPRLRALMATAKKENMPKENVERAIKKALSKDYTDYKEMNYEGYGPHGIAIFVETATDNTTRTVANVRSYFNKLGGSLGTSGSLEFLFDHKCVFHIAKQEGIDLESLELELIDFGVDEIVEDDEDIVIYGEFAQNSSIQNISKITVTKSHLQNSFVSLTIQKLSTRNKWPLLTNSSNASKRTKTCKTCSTTWQNLMKKSNHKIEM